MLSDISFEVNKPKPTKQKPKQLYNRCIISFMPCDFYLCDKRDYTIHILVRSVFIKCPDSFYCLRRWMVFYLDSNNGFGREMAWFWENCVWTAVFNETYRNTCSYGFLALSWIKWTSSFKLHLHNFSSKPIKYTCSSNNVRNSCMEFIL